MGDRYDEMKGPELVAELADRELPVQGKVDELRARLREADEAAELLDQHPGIEDESVEEIDVPEPRQPVEQFTVQVELSEEAARELTRLEARVAQFLKHVAPSLPVKYCAGDRVIAIDLGNGYVHVLASGVRVRVERDLEDED